MLILHGLQFHKPISLPVEDIEDAIYKSMRWLPGEDETIGEACPLYVSDESGNIVLTEDQLYEKLAETGLY